MRALTAHSLHRGADRVHHQLWNQPDVVIRNMTDDTVIDQLPVGRREAGQDSLWLANQMCDLVQARSSKGGTTIRLHMRK